MSEAVVWELAAAAFSLGLLVGSIPTLIATLYAIRSWKKVVESKDKVIALQNTTIEGVLDVRLGMAELAGMKDTARPKTPI